MPANESIPFKESGSSLTGKATAAITGGGAGGLSSDLANVYQVAQCVAGDRGIGVSKWDAANGALVGIHTGPGLIVPVTAGAAITAGQEVQSDANGQAIPLAAGKSLGVAMTGAANGADAEIKLLV
jgi:hypothetical protein